MTKEEVLKKAKEQIKERPEKIDVLLELVYTKGHADGVSDTAQFAIDLVAGKK